MIGVIVMISSLAFTACQDPDLGSVDVTPSLQDEPPGQELRTWDADMLALIERCGITWEEQYQVPVWQILMEQDLRTWECDQAHVRLAEWKKDNPNSWLYALENPVAAGDLPDLDGLRAMVLTVRPADAKGPDQLVVDVEGRTALTGRGSYVIAAPELGVTHALTDDQVRTLKEHLGRYVTTWDYLTPATPSSSGAAGPSWKLGLTFDDYRLFRFQSNGANDNLPPGFTDCIEGLWSLVEG